jgi:UDP-GlcNAc:undecaprenyl-phosphate/decaprenyl-phosphate GlcNAc-1-phosphate transferase
MILLLTFLTALFVSLATVPFVIKFANRYGFVDNPKLRKHPALLHKKTIPRAGGLSIYLAFLASIIFLVEPNKQILGIILGGFVLLVIGLIDDRVDIPSKYKFGAQILAAAVVVASGVGIVFIPNPISAILGQGYDVIRLDTIRWTFEFFGAHSILILADLFAVFWIVWVINMVNFSSGVDGQMPGIVFVTLIIIFAASMRFYPNDPSQLIVSQISLAAAGATLGFLFYNFNPAKIFPGDSGSYFLGFIVAVVAILSGAKVGTAVLVMAVPLIDGVFTIIRRTLSGKSPFLGDKKHLHHRLISLGWSQRRIALFYWILCAILGAAALQLASLEKMFAVIVVAVVVLGGLLWLNMSLPKKVQK